MDEEVVPVMIEGAEYITITQAATLAGYRVAGNLRLAAAQGKLQSIKVGPRLRLTKREWLDTYLAGLAHKEGWPRGKEREKRTPRRPASEEQQQ